MTRPIAVRRSGTDCPFTAAADIDGAGWDAIHSLVENLHICAASDPLGGFGHGRREAATVTRLARKRPAR